MAKPLTLKQLKARPWKSLSPYQRNRLKKAGMGPNSGNRSGPSLTPSQQYLNQAMSLQESLSGGGSGLDAGLMEALMSGAMGTGGGFQMPDLSGIMGAMGGISVGSGGGGGGGFSFPSGYPETVANAQFGVAIESLKRQIEETRTQTASNRAEIGNWFKNPIDRQATLAVENRAVADAAAEDVGDATQATMAAGGAEANPALAASLGSFGLLSQGAIEGIGQAHSNFDSAMQVALESQRNDAMLIEDRIGGKLVGDLQGNLANTENQRAATAAQVAGDLAIRSAEMNFQASQAAADRAMQAGIANAGIQQASAQMQFEAAMRGMELDIASKDSQFGKQLQLAQLLQETGGGGMNMMDLVGAAGQLFNMDVSGQMLPFQLQAAGLDIQSAQAGIGATQAGTAATLAGIPIAATAAADVHSLNQAQLQQIMNNIRQSNQPPPPVTVGWGQVSPGDKLNLRNTILSQFVTDKGKMTQHPLTIFTGVGQLMRSLSNGKWDVKKPSIGGFRAQIMRQMFGGKIITWNRTRWKLNNQGKPILHARLPAGSKNWVLVKKKK